MLAFSRSMYQLKLIYLLNQETIEPRKIIHFKIFNFKLECLVKKY